MFATVWQIQWWIRRASIICDLWPVCHDIVLQVRCLRKACEFGSLRCRAPDVLSFCMNICTQKLERFIALHRFYFQKAPLQCLSPPHKRDNISNWFWKEKQRSVWHGEKPRPCTQHFNISNDTVEFIGATWRRLWLCRDTYLSLALLEFFS